MRVWLNSSCQIYRVNLKLMWPSQYVIKFRGVRGTKKRKKPKNVGKRYQTGVKTQKIAWNHKKRHILEVSKERKKRGNQLKRGTLAPLKGMFVHCNSKYGHENPKCWRLINFAYQCLPCGKALTLGTRLLVGHTNSVWFSSNYEISTAILGITKPILGMFVLIWMHFSRWFQIWLLLSEILE